jgi:hypothetical protein
LAAVLGGAVALERAKASAELASARFSSGAWLIGILRDYDTAHESPAWLQFEGSVALAVGGKIGAECAALGRLQQWIVLTGPLADGTALEACAEAELAARCRDGYHEFVFASGARVRGRLLRSAQLQGVVRHFELEAVELQLPGCAPLRLERYLLLAAGTFVAAEAGAVDPAYHPEASSSLVRVPKPRNLPPAERRLLRLFERAAAAHAAGAQAMYEDFPEVHAALAGEFAREWLLRWNLLESLLKLGQSSQLIERLRAELEQLEIEHEHLQPIATGLRYLSERRSAA